VFAHRSRFHRKVLFDAFHVLALALSLGLAVPALAANLTIEDVRYMAFDKGIVKIKRSSSTRESGRSRARTLRAMRSIDAWSGQIIKLKRDD
jgi:hypothetical protein